MHSIFSDLSGIPFAYFLFPPILAGCMVVIFRAMQPGDNCRIQGFGMTVQFKRRRQEGPWVKPVKTCAKINLVFQSRVRSPYTVRNHKVAWLIVFLSLTACIGVWLWHRSKANPLRDAGVESRYIEGYSVGHPKPIAVVFVHGISGNDKTWGEGDLTLPHLLVTDPDLQKRVDIFLFEYESPWLRNADKIPDLAEELRGRLDAKRYMD